MVGNLDSNQYAAAVTEAQTARSNAMGGTPHPTTDNNPHVGLLRRAMQGNSRRMGHSDDQASSRGRRTGNQDDSLYY